MPFQTPHFITCTNRSQVRGVPSLPSAFYYREEIVSSAGSSKNADVSCISFVTWKDGNLDFLPTTHFSFQYSKQNSLHTISLRLFVLDAVASLPVFWLGVNFWIGRSHVCKGKNGQLIKSFVWFLVISRILFPL